VEEVQGTEYCRRENQCRHFENGGSNIYAAILKSETEWRRAAFKLKQVAGILNLVSVN
jgi:hypothetical protein